ncbi:hypothetical protein ACUNHT_26455, partial [Serratia sp. IR-2025]
VGDFELLLCHGTVCVVGKIRDLILQLSKSSIYSTKPPTSTARMTQQGNIASLKSGISSGKYKVVDSGGKRRLIDTSKKDTKTKTKRVIGLRETKKRKLVYDFYKEAEQGVRLVLSGVQGHFRISRM